MVYKVKVINRKMALVNQYKRIKNCRNVILNIINLINKKSNDNKPRKRYFLSGTVVGTVILSVQVGYEYKIVLANYLFITINSTNLSNQIEPTRL